MMNVAVDNIEKLKNSDSSEIWGLLSSIDLYDCDPDMIRDAEAIKNFVV